MKTINKWDVGSVESSDTYASCNTHPSASQGDLTEESPLELSIVPSNNLYINPLSDHNLNLQAKSVTAHITSDISSVQHQIVPHAHLFKTQSNSSLDSADYEEPTGKMEDDVNTGMPLLPHTVDYKMRQDAYNSYSPALKKPRFLQAIRQKSRFEDNRQSSLTSLDSLQSATGSLPGKAKIKTPFSSLRKGSKSLLLTDSPQMSRHSSPDAMKKKSILKKNASRKYSMSEQVMKADYGKPKCIVDDNFQNNNLPFSTSALLSPATRNKQPLKAIGPKTGPKPQAQPIKFVGLQDNSPLQSITPSIRRHSVQRISGSSCQRPLRRQSGIDTDQILPEPPQYSLPLHCTNLSCTYNQISHYTQLQPICYCGSGMKSLPLITDNTQCTLPKTNSPKQPDSNFPLRVPIVNIDDVDSTDIASLNKLNDEMSGMKLLNKYTSTSEIIGLPQHEYINEKEESQRHLLCHQASEESIILS